MIDKTAQDQIQDWIKYATRPVGGQCFYVDDLVWPQLERLGNNERVDFMVEHCPFLEYEEISYESTYRRMRLKEAYR